MKMTEKGKRSDHCHSFEEKENFIFNSVSSRRWATKSRHILSCLLLLLLFNPKSTAAVDSLGLSNNQENFLNESDPESLFPSDPELDGKDRDGVVSDSPVTSRPEAAQHTIPDPQGASKERGSQQTIGSLVFIAIVASICVVAFVAFVGGAYCWYRHATFMSATRRVFYRSSDASVLIHNDYQRMADGSPHLTVNGHVTHGTTTNNNLARLAQKTDYPAYGVTGPNPLHHASEGPPIDRRLSRSAEVYHYQQQKQKLKALSSASSETSGRSGPATSDTLNDFSTETREDDEENSDGEYTVYECPGLASTTDGPLEIHNPLFADSEDSFTSYRSSLGNNMTSAKYNYSATVSNEG